MTQLGLGELRVVEDVVAFHTELERADTIARQREVLGEDEVGVVDARAMVLVSPALVAEGAECLSSKAGR